MVSVFVYYNFTNKIIVDYDLSTGVEYKITPVEYFFFYKDGSKYDKEIIDVKKINDTLLVIKIKESDTIFRHNFYINDYQNVFRIFDKKADYKCECLDLKDITVYTQDNVFVFSTINGEYFDRAICYTKAGDNLYKSDLFRLKIKLKMDEIKRLDFNSFFDRNKKLIDTISSYGNIELDVKKNIFYEKDNEDNIKDLMNAQSLSSPFFHISGDLEYFNYLNSSDNKSF